MMAAEMQNSWKLNKLLSQVCVRQVQPPEMTSLGTAAALPAVWVALTS